MVRLVAVLVALLAVLAGCARPVAGSAVADETAAREAAEPLSSERALGDYPSLDYCSLMDQKAFPQRLGLVAVYPRGSYDYCFFTVQKSGTEARVEIGYLEDQKTIRGTDHAVDRRRNPPRGLEVHRGTEDDQACVRYLRFTDDLLLTVVASIDDQASRDLCEVADATVDVVIDRVVAKQVKHYEFAESSAGRLDACGLVPAGVVGAKIGTARAAVLKFPSGHVCQWTGPEPQSAEAWLHVTPGESSYDVELSKEETLAGRRTVVTPSTFDEDDLAMCQVETDLSAPAKPPPAEFVLIEVLVLGKEKDACGPARELAGEVWPKLPQ
jgi:hypothetical protein